MLSMWGRLKDRTYSLASPSVGNAERRAVNRVVRSGWMSQGREVLHFENSFARLMGVSSERVVAFNNGTNALTAALMATTPEGSAVLMPSLTYGGTLNAVLLAGLVPVFADVAIDSWCMSVKTCGDALGRADATAGPPVATCLPVHLYGHLSGVTETVTPKGMHVVEDACEALGAHDVHGYAGVRGAAGVFSFFANKQITTCGEGGAVVCESAELAREVRCIRGQGQHESERYVHRRRGINGRMLEVQGAFGVEQLRRFNMEHSHRQTLLRRYQQEFAHVGIVQMRNDTPFRGSAAPWLCGVRVPLDVRKTGLLSTLAAAGVEARPMFAPLHRSGMVETPPTYELPATELIAASALALPLHAKLTEHDVCEIVRRVVSCVTKTIQWHRAIPNLRALPWTLEEEATA